MMDLEYWLDLGSTAGTFFSILFAAVSAYFWHKASALPLPPEDPLPDEIPGKGMVELNGEDLSVLQVQIHAMFGRTRSALDALQEASTLNARGARWAMLTAVALGVNLVCSIGQRLAAG